MEETQPDIYQAGLFITIACITIILFLFIWKKEAHPDTRFKFRTLARQLWKIILLLALIVILLILFFDAPE
jgi:TRAP-type C4-dicarboxylate transport system permease large subunit